MLSAYRVIDATDHRGQMAGMILAGLGAEVILVEPPGGSPAPPPRRRPRVVGLQPRQAQRRVRRATTTCSSSCATPTCCSTAAAASTATPSRPLNPALVHVTISAFGCDGPKADWAASDLTILAAGCAQALNGDSDRAPVRTSVPQAWLHAGAEAAVGALLALTERQRSGRGQHVDVSAQQAVMQAGIPGVLLAPNDNPEAQRTSGGILTGPIHLQFVYPARDGYVSITLLFGTMIGPFTARLMEWVHDEGHCDAAMRDWDWPAFGLRLATHAEGAGELEAGEGGDHRADEQPHQGRAVRRGPAPPAPARPGRHGRRAGRQRAPARPAATGPRSTAGRAPARSSRRRRGRRRRWAHRPRSARTRRWPGGHRRRSRRPDAGRRRACRSPGSRSST